MTADDPVVLDILRRSRVARIATLSHSGRPSVNPLYFIYLKGKIWLGTPEWTLAVRNVIADPRVSLLFNVEQYPGDRRLLRISGQARVRTDPETQRSYNPRVVRKYVLTLGGIFNWLTHPRQLWLRHYYTAQSNRKGLAAVIEVIPERIEILTDY